jgi:hypothetical protein
MPATALRPITTACSAFVNSTDSTSLPSAYGGGGHEAAGTCQVSNEDGDRVREELIERSPPTADAGAS